MPIQVKYCHFRYRIAIPGTLLPLLAGELAPVLASLGDAGEVQKTYMDEGVVNTLRTDVLVRPSLRLSGLKTSMCADSFGVLSEI